MTNESKPLCPACGLPDNHSDEGRALCVALRKPKRGRRPLAASVVRLEIRVPEFLARMAEERAATRGITTAELWREAMHAHLGQPKEAR